MKTSIFLVLLCAVANAVGCAFDYQITANNIDNLPLIAFIDNNDEFAPINKQADKITFRIYLRDTANLEGLTSVSMSMKNDDGESVFSGDLSIFHDEENDQNMVSFTMKKDLIPSITLTICANTPSTNEQGEPIHSCLFVYSISLDLIYDHFKNNTFESIVVDSDQTVEMEKFEAKKFIQDRGKSVPEISVTEAQPTDVIPQPTSTVIIYPGETLDDVARRCGVSLADLKKANGIGENDKVYAGMKLSIPQKESPK